MGTRVREGDVGAGDRGGPGATVGHEHVAVDDDRVLAEALQVDTAAERATDQTADLDRNGTPQPIKARASPTLAS